MSNEEIGKEGVTCEVCHRVAKTNQNSMRHRLVMDPRNIEYSRDNSTDTPFHAVRVGESLGNSSLCGGCHLDILKNGIPLERTYREWSGSFYAQNNIYCINCHMPSTKGSATISPKGIYEKNATHASHQFAGGHSESLLLPGAATLSLKADLETYRLQVQITNALVGHHFPTGGAHPSELVLELTFENADGVPIGSDRRIFKLWYLNSKGQPVSTGENAVSVRDTTLPPQQTRSESFILPKSSNSISAKLVYYPISLNEQVRYDKQTVKTYYKPVLIAQCTALLTNLAMNTCTQ